MGGEGASGTLVTLIYIPLPSKQLRQAKQWVGDFFPCVELAARRPG